MRASTSDKAILKLLSLTAGREGSGDLRILWDDFVDRVRGIHREGFDLYDGDFKEALAVDLRTLSALDLVHVEFSSDPEQRAESPDTLELTPGGALAASMLMLPEGAGSAVSRALEQDRQTAAPHEDADRHSVESESA